MRFQAKRAERGKDDVRRRETTRGPARAANEGGSKDVSRAPMTTARTTRRRVRGQGVPCGRAGSMLHREIESIRATVTENSVCG